MQKPKPVAIEAKSDREKQLEAMQCSLDDPDGCVACGS